MRFHFALAAVAVLGCSSSYRDTTDSVELSLSRKGGQLLLQGTQLDPSYVGRYVNPRAIEQMTVRLTKSGELVGVCRDEVGESDCGNVPFYSAIRTDGERRLIEAWDIHGTLVARLGCTDSEFCAPITPGECGSDDVSACSSTGGGGTDTTNDNETPAGGGGWEDFFSWATGGGGGSGGSGTTGTPGEDGSSSSSWTDGWTDSGSTGTDGTDGSTGTTNWGTREEDEFIGTPTGCTAPPKTDDCGVIKEWAQDCFCDLVNRRLESFKVGTQIDCSQLGDAYVYQPITNWDYDGPFKCENTLIEPSDSMIEVAVEDACPRIEPVIDTWVSQADNILRSGGYCGSSPLVVDLAGDGVNLSTLAQGTRFDLLGTGQQVACAWTTGDDGFVALDRNGNGSIDGAAELFGNATDGRRFADGFAALRELDRNADGVIDAKDAVYSRLVVWRDRDRNGTSTPGELASLPSLGIQNLRVDAQVRTGDDSVDGKGNFIPLVSSFTRANGKTGQLVDVFFQFTPPTK